MAVVKAEEDKKQHIDDIAAIAHERDQQAFVRLFDHFVPLIRAFSMAAQPGASLMADEIAQEVMLKVWKKAHTYKPESAAVSTWIYTLARNTRIDYLRKNSKHLSSIDPEYVWSELVDEANGPFQNALQRRNEDQVTLNMQYLPEEQRKVLEKVYLDGKTHVEVSEELCLPLGTVKSRIRLALSKLAISIKR